MKNLSNLKILLVVFIGLGLYGNGYACGQNLNIKTNSNDFIYFELPNFQPFTEIKNSMTYAKIRPITCKFSTKYTKNITFQVTPHDGYNYMKKTITAQTPFKYVFQGFYPYGDGYFSPLDIFNNGCSSATDGDNCIEAKQQNLDNLIVNCN